MPRIRFVKCSGNLLISARCNARRQVTRPAQLFGFMRNSHMRDGMRGGNLAQCLDASAVIQLDLLPVDILFCHTRSLGKMRKERKPDRDRKSVV